jgi:hypothetical protein
MLLVRQRLNDKGHTSGVGGVVQRYTKSDGKKDESQGDDGFHDIRNPQLSSKRKVLADPPVLAKYSS